MKKPTAKWKPTAKERVRTFALNSAARILGREMIQHDFDKLKRMGVIEFGRHTGERPIVRGYYSVEDEDLKIRAGNFTGIHSSVVFALGGRHRMDWVTTYPLRDILLKKRGIDGPFSKGDINIGSDVWIGYEAMVLSGVTIGDGAVVAARAVITRDVRPYAIVAGSPAREVRRRFGDEQIEALLRIAWWDWSDEKIIEHADLLCSPEVDKFIELFDPQAR